MHCLQRLMRQFKIIDSNNTYGDLCILCILPTKHESTNICRPPKCTSYSLGKTERVITSTNQINICKSGKLCRDGLLPGNVTSMDQFVVSIKGRTLKSSINGSIKYNGGSIYVNHSSQHIFTHNQISLRSGDTLIVKYILEREGRTSVIIC